MEEVAAPTFDGVHCAAIDDPQDIVLVVYEMGQAPWAPWPMGPVGPWAQWAQWAL